MWILQMLDVFVFHFGASLPVLGDATLQTEVRSLVGGADCATLQVLRKKAVASNP